jgi:cobalt-zinc-cadmium efflux system outer membrane protein
LDYHRVEPDIEALRITAMEMRPDIRVRRLTQSQRYADLKLAKAYRYPDVTVGAGYAFQGAQGPDNPQQWGMNVGVPLPLFNRNQGEIVRAEADVDKATRSLTAIETDVAGQVASAYAEFTASRQLVDEIEHDLLEPTDQARTGTAYVYQAGAASLLDVLDAQRAYNDTMETYYSAQAAYRRAQARLTLAIGTETAQ